jgi:hypothetical protein
MWVSGKRAVNLTRDFVPVAAISRLPMATVVYPSVPTKTVPEFIAYANANPGKINRAWGKRKRDNVAGALFMMMSGIKMLHVPHRGGAPVITDLLAGQTQVYFGSMPEILGHIRARKLRVLLCDGEGWTTFRQTRTKEASRSISEPRAGIPRVGTSSPPLTPPISAWPKMSGVGTECVVGPVVLGSWRLATHHVSKWSTFRSIRPSGH